MLPTPPFLRAVTVLLLLAAAPLLRADTGVRYELRAGSTIRDECLPCDRAPIERDLRGTVLITSGAAGAENQAYDLTVIDFSDGAGDYHVTGAGSYTRWFDSPRTQELELTVDISGTGPIQLSSGRAALPLDCWPAIEIAASEPQDPPRDPFHLFTLNLVLAPVADYVAYELIPGVENGSYIYRECLPCGLPAIFPVPLAGTFLLGKIQENTLFTTYRLEAIDFRNASGNDAWQVTGDGCFSQGGEVALTQEMGLQAAINQTPGVVLTSGENGNTRVPIDRPLPEIEVVVKGLDPSAKIFQYTLNLVARPVGSPAFRRGDSNSDARIDISDAVRVLFWLFGTVDPPSCLEAADANGDGKNDVADAVYLLLYLFQAGKPPPAPGPDSCGQSPKPVLGCQKDPGCAAPGA